MDGHKRLKPLIDAVDNQALLKTLIDRYGFSYATASQIVAREDAGTIVSYIGQAYAKGRDYDRDAWAGGSYG